MKRILVAVVTVALVGAACSTEDGDEAEPAQVAARCSFADPTIPSSVCDPGLKSTTIPDAAGTEDWVSAADAAFITEVRGALSGPLTEGGADVAATSNTSLIAFGIAACEALAGGSTPDSLTAGGRTVDSTTAVATIVAAARTSFC